MFLLIYITVNIKTAL